MYFVTEKNEKIELYPDHRRFIKPDWEVMLKPHLAEDEYKIKVSQDVVDGDRQLARGLKEQLDEKKIDLRDKWILEVGCHAGGFSYALAEVFDAYVEGIDIPDYGVVQSANLDVNPENLGKQSEFLERVRQEVSKSFSQKVKDKVNFAHLDVAEMEAKSEYDAVFSFDVFEHLSDPKKALENIYRSLKPGGVSFHRFNSFFSITGGHSLCTLDFPYGHCSLSPSDYKTYINKFRPLEVKQAIDFYEKSLNRLTLHDLGKWLVECGFAIHFVACRLKNGLDPERLKERITKEYLPRVREIYPGVCMEDLLGDQVMVLLEKPKESV